MESKDPFTRLHYFAQYFARIFLWIPGCFLLDNSTPPRPECRKRRLPFFLFQRFPSPRTSGKRLRAPLGRVIRLDPPAPPPPNYLSLSIYSFKPPPPSKVKLAFSLPGLPVPILCAFSGNLGTFPRVMGFRVWPPPLYRRDHSILSPRCPPIWDLALPVEKTYPDWYAVNRGCQGHSFESVWLFPQNCFFSLRSSFPDFLKIPDRPCASSLFVTIEGMGRDQERRISTNRKRLLPRVFLIFLL